MFLGFVLNEMKSELTWIGLSDMKVRKYRKLALSTRSRFEPALAYNPRFSRNLFSNARLEPSFRIAEKTTIRG